MPPRQLRIATRNCGFIDPENLDDYLAVGGYSALAQTLKKPPADTVNAILNSGLRGRGGAGFPTGKKWAAAQKQPGREKYVICNADEGDPGAFMDRAILEGDPHTIVEGMAIAGFAIGANTGEVYIRAEYPLAVKRLKQAIADAQQAGLLGKNILGTNFSFDIEIKYGAGAFVCGEETALIHSMEGERGEPRMRPPFPAEQGYRGKPSLLNNVETFANVPVILAKGADWFASIGTEKSKGTKVFALTGHIKNVGLVEVPMGTTLREVIFDIGGGCPGNKSFKAVLTGGPSGGALSAKDLDLPIDYEHLAEHQAIMGSGGMVVMDEDDCMVSIARFFTEFTQDESCGKCTPCRVGSRRMFEILDRITSGKGEPSDLIQLRLLSESIKDTALCGLGQTMPNPVISTLLTFPEEYDEHVRDHHCQARVCRDLLTFAINPEKCTGCHVCAVKCPTQCIGGERKKPHSINLRECIRCGICYDVCKFFAVVKR